MRPRKWWHYGLVGAVVLSVITAFKVIRALPRLFKAEVDLTEALGFPVAVVGMGFVCGVVVWAGRGLSRRFGMVGDAVTGMVVMVVFFLSCMLLFDPELLGRKLAVGGLPMLGLGVATGILGGAWLGRGIRKQLEAEIERNQQLLFECRERVGTPPRMLAQKELEAFQLTLSPEVEQLFLENRDDMLRILRDQPLLHSRGQVVWGHLVQANPLLFDPDNQETLPAAIIYSLDPYFEGHIASLAGIAKDLFALKGKVPRDEELREFVHVITDERARILRRELPQGYCDGHSVYFATCFIQPQHLPDNYLARQVFPVLVNFQETEAVMILPSSFWPPEMLSEWQG